MRNETETAKENDVKDKQMIAELFVFFPGCNKTFASKRK